MSSIFISHSSRDNATAADLNGWLAESGHRSVFLDFDPSKGIPAGRDWEKELYRNIRSCRAVVAICSAHWLSSPWCFMELTYARALGKHIFPIRVDDAALDGLIRDTQIVDFRQDKPGALSRLGNGLLAAGLDPADAFDWDGSRSVYPGLLAFEEEDAAIFFGRDEEIGDGLDLLNKCHRLGDTRLVLVLGASGSGKSSLMRAGMLPRLRRDTTRWLVVDPFRPRDDPASELAAVLTRAFARVGAPRSLESIREVLIDDATTSKPTAADAAEPPAFGDVARFLDAVTAAEAQLPPALRSRVAAALRPLRTLAASAGAPASSALTSPQDNRATVTPLSTALTSLRRSLGTSDASTLLTIDQFEELLGHPPDHPCTAFLRLLGDSLRDGGSLTVVATMRSDFLGHFQQAPALSGLRYESLSLGPMSAEDIEAVIGRPADLAGITLGPGLVQALIDDARAQDALPLLAFTLRELADRYSADGRIDVEEYRTGLGGMQAALAKSADELLDTAALTPPSLDDLRRAFLRMVRITEDGTYARRFVRWTDLPSTSRALLERFVKARLLVSRGEGLESVVEVAHEAIFKSWARLAGWLKDGAAALQLREQIRAAAASWNAAGRPADDLWRGGRLVRARELRDKGDVPLEPIESRFVEESIAAEDARVAADRARRRNRMLGLGVAAVVGVGLSIVAGVSAILARRAEVQADVAAHSAEERAREASIAAERARAAQSFAEYQRVRARLQSADPGSFQARALAALAPKYQDQSRRHVAEAGKLENSLAVWKQQSGASQAQATAALSLEMVQARNNGNSLLLHYGPPSAPRLMLFDGGDRADYARVLKPRLLALRQERSVNAPLPIDLVVSTQTDIQHMGGLIRFISDLVGAANGPPFARVDTLWSNAFLPPGQAATDEVVRLQQKAALIVDARRLGIPVNKPFTKLVTLPEAGVARIHGQEGLTITVLGPSLEYLRAFAKWWLADWRRREARGSDGVVRSNLTAGGQDGDADAIVDDLTIEGFADPTLELIPSPLEIVRPEVPAGQERSLVNLGSIVLLVELAGKRILLPADSRADVLMSGLAQAGYTDEQGNVALDVMAIPHGGSANNVSLEFFKRVRADHYVFQADGTFTNPKPETIKMLFDARRSDRRPFAIYFTFPPEQFKKGYPVAALCALLADERAAGSPYRLIMPQPGMSSLAIHLLQSLPQLPSGTESGACRGGAL